MKNNPTNVNKVVVACLRETVGSLSKALDSAKDERDNAKVAELNFIKKYIENYVDFLDSQENCIDKNLGGNENEK